MQGRVHSVESFGTVDGPGIRYVVFLQGCPMRCQYCHNPDTWETRGGTLTEPEEILAAYEKNRAFLKSGGITVTGGEPLLQIAFVTELFEKAKARGIHTCLDTSGITFQRDKETLAAFDRLVKATDLILLDIKHIDPQEHKKLTGWSNERVLDFAVYLKEKQVPVWVRHVVVPGITDREESLRALGRFLGGLPNVRALDVLPYHDMAKAKYKAMGMDYPLGDTPPLSKEAAAKARVVILSGMRERLRGK